MAESGPQGSLTVFWKRRLAPPHSARFGGGGGPARGGLDGATSRQEGFGRRRGTPISVQGRRLGTKFQILPLTMKYSFCFIPDCEINPQTRRKRTNFPDMRHPPSPEKQTNRFLQTT